MTVAELIIKLHRLPLDSVVDYEGHPINCVHDGTGEDTRPESRGVTLAEFECCFRCG
ncbi:hypothetical protein [Streptomyces sp. NPDC101393]|uniref:hypothetical protein n=1 Tax=Streptomyces sp. NPDC101393 TaxID=3366141 RepID=UPI0037FEE72A